MELFLLGLIAGLAVSDLWRRSVHPVPRALLPPPEDEH